MTAHTLGAVMIALPFILWTIYGVRVVGWKWVFGFYAVVAALFAWVGIAIHLLQGR